MEAIASDKLLVGFQSGRLVLFDFKSLEVESEIETAHKQKQEEGVTCLSALKVDKETKDQKQVPFFLSGGAEGALKVLEYNPYQGPSVK
jgi:hypothetical protein